MSAEFGRTRQATRLKEDQESSNDHTLVPKVIQDVECVPKMGILQDDQVQITPSNDGEEPMVQAQNEFLIESSNNENEIIYLLASAVSDFWTYNLFHDVTIHCAKDGGAIRSHRIVLAGLSPLFQLILKDAEQDCDQANSDELVIVLPDVSSKVLLPFLDSIYKGKDDEAIIHEEIIHLEFCHELKIQSHVDTVKVAPTISNENTINDKEVISNQFEDIETSRYRSKRSFVWDYFSPVGKQNAQCKICKKIQKVERSSTTYLIRHLKTHHPEEYGECRKNQGNEDVVDSKSDELSDPEEMDCSFIEATAEASEVEKQTNDYALSPIKSSVKHPAQPVSKFRSLTNQISKLAKHKSASLCAVDGSIISDGRKKRSLCWKYFTRSSIAHQDDVASRSIEKECKCNLCGRTFPFSSSKSTILMLRHLRKEHSQVLNSSSSHLKHEGQKKVLQKDILSKIVGVDCLDIPTTSHECMESKSIHAEQFEIVSSAGETKQKSLKRKQNATLREQKELRERALVMFSKPTKPRVKTPSVAWIFFDVINKDTARCTICGNIVPTPLWNTNGLLRHLKKDHLDECEQWEAQNVQNFDPSKVPTGQSHPILQYFKKIDATLKEGVDGGSYTCNYCDIVHVGIIFPQHIYQLESHLKQCNPDDAFREYEMEKVAILCRKRKEQMKIMTDESGGTGFQQPDYVNQSMTLSIDSENNSSAMNVINLQPHEIIQDIETGLLNVLAGDFFTQFSRDTMQCNLCLAACKVLTNGPNRSNNLWKHLSVSHVDIHGRLESEREIIVNCLKKSNPSHPIWNFFSASNKTIQNRLSSTSLCFVCKICEKTVEDATVELGGHLSNSVEYLEEHLLTCHSSNGDETYNQYQKQMSKEDVILSMDHTIWIETCSGLKTICDSFYEIIREESCTNTKEDKNSPKYSCRKCNKEIINVLDIDVENKKRAHVMKEHKQDFYDLIKVAKQQGFFQASTIDRLKNSVGKERSNDGLNGIMINDSESVCSKCDTFFVSSTALEFHDRCIHLGERPYACDDCDRTFVRSDELKTHKKYHTDRALQKGAMCVQCGKQFNSATARKRHENTVHLDIRNHICKMCGKKFHSPQALERHSHTHSDEKPFACTECGAKFREKHQLTSHRRTHTGEASITCPNCPMTFKHYAARSKHKCSGDMLISNSISSSWEQHEIEKVDVSIVTVSSSASSAFKQKIVG